jgi:hypothetical protein
VTVSATRYITTTRSVTLAADARLDVVLQRNDTFPADGTYTYTLVVRSPAWCLTHGYNISSGYTDWVNSDFSWDGQLVVEGEARASGLCCHQTHGRGGETIPRLCSNVRGLNETER